MITKTTGKDYYYRDDIDFYVDTQDELEAMDITYVLHASKAYVIETGKTMILAGDGNWAVFKNGTPAPEPDEESDEEPVD